jgi:putative aldouronate transport system permease protein
MRTITTISDRRYADLTYDVVRMSILVLFTISCFLPFIHVLGISLMPQRQALKSTAIIWPAKIDLTAYKVIFQTRKIMQGLKNSLIITVTGTIISLVVTSSFAYGLSKQKMPGHRFFNGLLVFLMMFHGGIIPLYLVVKTIGLLNSYFSVIFALAINPFWCILMRNFFEQLPQELFENAEIEGASEVAVYTKIVLPLSRAAMAAFTLFYAVMFWNRFFYALMFISDDDKWPIQVWLREMIVNEAAVGLSPADREMEDAVRAPVTMQMAVVITATVPILLVYPFLQKHFAKGVMLGSVKG